MFGWLRKVFAGATLPNPWAVSIVDDVIITSDGQGTERRLKVADLRRVVVATDDSGPWGDDVVFLLFAEEVDPAALFPLEAAGGQDFVGWMSRQPGYRDGELASAMSSTRVARFLVFQAEA
jgi:hypothetical protein